MPAFTTDTNGIPYQGVCVELSLYKEGELLSRYSSSSRDRRKAKLKEWNNRIKPLSNKNQYFIIIKIDH